MNQGDTYTPKPFDLHGLNVISDRTIDMPMKLFDGYVREMKRFTPLLRDVGWSSQKRDGGFVLYLMINLADIELHDRSPR